MGNPYIGGRGMFEGMFDDDPLIEALERGDDPEDEEYDEDGEDEDDFDPYQDAE